MSLYSVRIEDWESLRLDFFFDEYFIFPSYENKVINLNLQDQG